MINTTVPEQQRVSVPHLFIWSMWTFSPDWYIDRRAYSMLESLHALLNIPQASRCTPWSALHPQSDALVHSCLRSAWHLLIFGPTARGAGSWQHVICVPLCAVFKDCGAHHKRQGGILEQKQGRWWQRPHHVGGDDDTGCRDLCVCLCVLCPSFTFYAWYWFK